MTYILGIETSCDETAVAVVKDGKEILSNVVSSQEDLHALYGGVVPELACRRHIDVLIPLLNEALNKANISLEKLDAIAVTKGPGLIGALLIGINAAKTLAFALNKPLIGVNHVEAHLYAALMSTDEEVSFPCLGVVLSGGHTQLIEIKEIGKYRLLGSTTDDAVGEAFDKVAALLNLSYPGGPQVERLAKEGNPHRYSFKAGVVKGKPLDFSFSGLKTAVLYAVKGQSAKKDGPSIISEADKKDIAASFQHAAFTDIIQKTHLAAKEHACPTILLGGGVSNNRALRDYFAKHNEGRTIIFPSFGLSLDNAAMIAGLGFHHYIQGKRDDLTLEAQTRIPLF